MDLLQSTEEEAAWCRRLGSAANNRGWALSEQSSRTLEEDHEMLNAAHAAMHLWSGIGNERNLALGRLLLGHVHALLGNANYAMECAMSAHGYLTSKDGAAWEVAIAHAVLANAARCAGKTALHESSYRTAEVLIAALPDPEDREILLATLRVVPRPLGGGKAA